MMTIFDVRRRTNFLLTAMGVRRKGFYTPYNYLDSVPETVEPYHEAAAILDAHQRDFARFLRMIDAQEARFLAMGDGAVVPNWGSRFLPRLDAASLYTAVATFRPRTLVEVGSGNSTFFACRAVIDHGLPTTIHCIDPEPRADVRALPVVLQRRALSERDLPMIEDLRENDILFVDSSHLLHPGFDVDIILNRFLPRLAAGVLVHFHDIFLPYPYPPDWAPHRFNEQCALLPWLLTGAFVPVFASYYCLRDMPEQVSSVCLRLPLHAPSEGGSLWLRRA